MQILSRIWARAAEGVAAAAVSNTHPTNDLGIIPDWEGLALVAFPALIVFCVCLADMLRGTGGAV